MLTRLFLWTGGRKLDCCTQTETSPLACFSSELKSGERMLMICRRNEARPDKSPANVFIKTKKLGNKWRDGEGGGFERKEKNKEQNSD